MKNLRAKLWMGFGGMLAILTIVSVLGVVVITLYSQAIKKVLWENDRSVRYGQEMLKALDQRTNDVQRLALGQAWTGDSLAGRQQASRDLFNTNLQLEFQNITLPGEADAARRVAEASEAYEAAFGAAMTPGLSQEQRMGAIQAVLERLAEVKLAVQQIITMNENNMASVDGHLEEWASAARNVLILLLAAGLILGVVEIAFVGRWILKPLRTLTRSAREIEAGNLNLIVPVKSRDEVGQLAEAFNSMAAKLRAFRETDQAKLLRTQQTTQLAIDSLPDAVAVVNPEGLIELANGAATRLFNIKPNTLLGALALGWLSDLFRAVLETQRVFEPQGYQSALQVFDNGAEKFFLPQGVPIMDAAGRLVGVTVVLIDVTRLRQIDEIKSSLVSTVSHELRTPLTSIRLANHLLLSDRIGALSPKQTEVVVESRDNADRLQKIIENLLDMSRIEAGNTALQMGPMTPHQLAAETADQVRGAAQEKGIELAVDVPVELPRVRADHTRVNHVLLNLLNNAIRYTSAGGKITLSAQPEKEMVKFEVKDTGQGIPAPYQGRVFERFFRVPGQNGGGVGLGLAIAREIVQAHGGVIGVKSQEGVGTTFCFTLPQETNGG